MHQETPTTFLEFHYIPVELGREMEAMKSGEQEIQHKF